jgi:hypothetical protein
VAAGTDVVIGAAKNKFKMWLFGLVAPVAIPILLASGIALSAAGFATNSSGVIGCPTSTGSTGPAAPITAQVIQASKYGGKGDPSSGHTGAFGDLLDGQAAFAELSSNPLSKSGWDWSALGGLPPHSLLRVTYHGITLVVEKMDVGRGGRSYPKLDLWYEVANVLGFPGLDKLEISPAQPGDVDSLTPITGTASTATPTLSCDLTGIGVPGNVTIAPGANLPGQPVQPDTLAFLAQVAGIYGKTMICTTGTNHSKYTVDGNVSDHYSGHACDFGMNANGGADDSPIGDAITRACLIVAGDSPALAAQEAVGGGLFTRVHNGLRIQCIWKTYEGGNHHNHVHIGAHPV